MDGRKDDGLSGTGALKSRWELLPWGPVAEVVEVLGHGARKYSPWNFLKVADGRTRYFAAAIRHLLADWAGEELDPDSGLPHLAHAVCCLLFIRELKRRGIEGS